MLLTILFGVLFISYPVSGLTAGSEAGGHSSDFTATTYGLIALTVFIIAYAFVINEERIHLRKSKPVIVAAGIIWVLVALAYAGAGRTKEVEEILNHNLLEYIKLLLFLLAAMTFINTLDERNIFAALRTWLVSKGFSLCWIFWITGVLAFFISPLADNLTTALLMAAVLIAVAANKPEFITMGCVNIVVAANAGGAFSPFGDITTLMVWQAGIVRFEQFLVLFVPSVVNWVIPALIMSVFIEKGKPGSLQKTVKVKKGGFVVAGLFVLTIATAVTFHNVLHLPPMLGMMTGLGVLKIYGYFIRRNELSMWAEPALSIEGLPAELN